MIIKRLNNTQTSVESIIKDFDWDKRALVTHLMQTSAKEYLKLVDSQALTEVIQKCINISGDSMIQFPPPKNPKFTFIDLFAGIGGTRLAFQNLGNKCVFSSEWDAQAQYTYYKNFGEYPWGDIKKIDEDSIPDHDILLAGFPCQPFSIAGVSKKNSLGKLHGFDDETQGTLFYDIVRILRKKKPKAFLLENVKNLLSHDKGKTFQVISKKLSELEYDWHFKIIDGKYYVPQHRERIIIVGFHRDLWSNGIKFVYPNFNDYGIKSVQDILESSVPEKYTLSDHLWGYLQNYAIKHKLKGNGFSFGLANLDGVSRTLSARYYKDGSEILIPIQRSNPRRLTPRECARLMGFPENFIIPVSDTAAYKQFGNSVIVPMIQDVGKHILEVLSS